MLDVDHFKKFNDTHGHDIGDQVLQMVATKIGQVGGGGKAFRYSGEEFAVIFSRLSAEDAFYHLDELRRSIQNYELVIREDPRAVDTANAPKSGATKTDRKKGSYRTASAKVAVTISIGVAQKSRSRLKPDDVLKLADEALYVAKKAGRNQVSVSSAV